ncbi:hypothetical protein F7725_014899 [Dissostichus mawsoni]|uniref:Uncharacterized protein n=1 Tax=Dissostichus mawsoni TaxID=36200 RepID=A0A7J5YG05_DISMA|nr:hypothetical protein F7725_014899 [Dissostichus mawsoni]
MEKGASIRNVIYFLCRKDVLPNKRFLVIFLLLSTVSERMDPLVETFSTFCQELTGDTEQILYLIEARCGINISGRCIYDLSFAEVNGTILSLLSKNRRSSRFLPCGGGSKVSFEKKAERSLSSLEVLKQDQIVIEENFYKGGKVSWWNFYFSEQPASTPFIKRDKFEFIMDTVIPDLCSLRNACVVFNLVHVPGCGGTTLAMHTLWALRDKFRCAVLRDSNADFAEVADQVVNLLMYKHEKKSPSIPVLLMIEDFDDKEKVFDLQAHRERVCQEKDSVKVFTEGAELFENKLKEIEKTHKNADTFYGFMILKKNFNAEYVQGVARNTLKSFDIKQKHAQLLAVLVLLKVYCNRSSLSVSLCEEFLGLHPVCGTIKVEEGFGKFSTLIDTCSVEGKVVFKAVKMIHPSIAMHCLQELTTTHHVSKADITDILLTTDKLYESTQGKDQLLQDSPHFGDEISFITGQVLLPKEEDFLEAADWARKQGNSPRTAPILLTHQHKLSSMS